MSKQWRIESYKIALTNILQKTEVNSENSVLLYNIGIDAVVSTVL